jgi:phosphoribosylanthranilate isomerase
MTPRWKVCGVRDAAIAATAVAAGADAIGFVFYPPSPRAVTLEQAAAIAVDLPREIWRVGVFVDAPRDVLEHAIDAVGLDFVQLAGDEPASAADGLSRHAFKALRLEPEISPAAAMAYAAKYPNCTLLVDAAVPGEYGGTGQATNWTAAAALASEHRLMLAGGLTAANVAMALKLVKPWAIDVSSGLESSPGCKDPELIAKFGSVLESLR